MKGANGAAMPGKRNAGRLRKQMRVMVNEAPDGESGADRGLHASMMPGRPPLFSARRAPMFGCLEQGKLPSLN